MTYCSKCGSRIESSNEFCPNCGMKVNQTSNKNRNKEKMEGTFEHVKSVTDKINATEIINIFKNSTLNPVSGGKEFVAKTQKTSAIVIMIMLTCLQGILGIWRVNQIVSSVSTIFTNFYRNLSSLAVLFGESSSSYNMDTSTINSMNTAIDKFKYMNTIPYGKIFFGNCELYLVGLLVLFISIYLGISFFSEVKCTTFMVFKAVLTSTLPILFCEIISIIFSYFSLNLGIVFVILGVGISITTLVIISKETFQINANLCVLIISIASVISLIVFLIAFSYHTVDVVKAIVYRYGSLLN
ncbi:zinc ribbon domain-containing protein [Clostridium estertheticum]|uniref:zinc ribbon domain-containing protein n=1 Tax=Clostridium estertheticum TaxID=238834 RepID=UPI001C7D9F16|nr:zinc ribbon domain-containing protein [Clostridium estertheticum]MBX4268592.1 zinc-ribbon domain-containing protein [Clostridium estertheticum]WLC81351.1 zinc-ribbon domain-containing protein [Clostridium estertheticum]